MYDKNKLLEVLDLLCKAALMINDLNQDEEPFSYTEPINKIAGGIDDTAEGISELLAIMEAEA